MVHIITSVSRFSIIVLFAVYTYSSFAALRRGIKDTALSFFSFQISLLILILYNANIVIFLNTKNIEVLILSVLETVFVLIVQLIYKYIYKESSLSLVNNMCMLLCIGFCVLTRLDINLAKRQIFISFVSLAVTCIVPLIIHRIRIFNYLTWLYAIIGIAGLLAVRLFGRSEYGANLSLNFGSFSLQPSELIKVVFVFFVACRFYKSTEFKDVCKTTVVAALHVLILVLNRDLGGGFVFLITYLIMLYVATRKLSYFLLGIGASSIAFIIANKIFPHVHARVEAFVDPLAKIDTSGYQVSQSLFAIGTGGWFGSGLCEGIPSTIPVVSEDFIFAAISEELGGFFALCLLFVCISIYLMFMNISIRIKNTFYKLLALGLACVYGAQVFVSTGGVIKFIPSTGITLPLVSYGGSSILSTMLIFAIIQGLYQYRNDEMEEEYENI